jgi:hypothetical protein
MRVALSISPDREGLGNQCYINVINTRTIPVVNTYYGTVIDILRLRIVNRN